MKIVELQFGSLSYTEKLESLKPLEVFFVVDRQPANTVSFIDFFKRRLVFLIAANKLEFVSFLCYRLTCKPHNEK